MIESKENKDLEERIERYANGELNADQVDELWAELIQDEYYLDYMKSVVNLNAVLAQKYGAKKRAKLLSFNKFTKYTTTAAAVVLIGIAGILTFNNQQNIESVQPIDHIGMDVTRSSEGVSEIIINETIRNAIRLASEGETEQAIVLLEEELKTALEPQLIADIALILGSIHYNAGDYSISIDHFEILVSQSQIDILTLEKGYWYMGNAYFQLDELEEAEINFQKVYTLNGAYSRVSKTYVDALNKVL